MPTPFQPLITITWKANTKKAPSLSLSQSIHIHQVLLYPIIIRLIGSFLSLTTDLFAFTLTFTNNVCQIDPFSITCTHVYHSLIMYNNIIHINNSLLSLNKRLHDLDTNHPNLLLFVYYQLRTIFLTIQLNSSNPEQCYQYLISFL
jgi:hypothetical protein